MDDEPSAGGALDSDWPLQVRRLRLRESVAPHGHECGEIQVILGGSAAHIVDGRAYRVAAGDVFVIRGASVHGFEEVQELELYTVGYDPRRPVIATTEIAGLEGFQCLFVLEPYFRSAHEFDSRLRLTQSDQHIARALLDQMLGELTSRRDGYRSMVRALALQLVTFLSRAYTAQASGPSERLVRLAGALSELERDYLDEVSLPAIAARACVSERHFRRLFKELYGVPPLAWVLELRLREAARLLLETSLPVTEVALRSGFGDSNYLARQFRARHGESPREYRRRRLAAR